MDNIKVLNDIWLTNPYEDWGWKREVCVGIIKAKDTITDEIHYYVGQVKGEDYKEDVASILGWGTKYTEEEYKSFLERI